VVAQALGARPFERLAFQRLDEALPAATDVERRQQVEAFVSVAGEAQRREAGGFHRDAGRRAQERRSQPLSCAPMRLFVTTALPRLVIL